MLVSKFLLDHNAISISSYIFADTYINTFKTDFPFLNHFKKNTP